ncbi:alpha N-terminal protein methyltransferase 1B [Lates japonicus]|uniref:Alpha N-terminal protein methyltransferase 1B n=1 Tax=Lates japonicus TaxID=270547 RepID=A0AAD3NKP5_LATJO|nr:alpha N-terminal protein methyltransferase 1B [Lates japonicus]
MGDFVEISNIDLEGSRSFEEEACGSQGRHTLRPGLWLWDHAGPKKSSFKRVYAIIIKGQHGAAGLQAGPSHRQQHQPPPDIMKSITAKAGPGGLGCREAGRLPEIIMPVWMIAMK